MPVFSIDGHMAAPVCSLSLIYRLQSLTTRAYNPRMAREKLLRTRDVCDYLSVHYVTLWRWIKDGRFPQPIKLGARLAWTQADVDQWLESRRAA